MNELVAVTTLLLALHYRRSDEIIRHHGPHTDTPIAEDEWTQYSGMEKN